MRTKLLRPHAISLLVLVLASPARENDAVGELRFSLARVLADAIADDSEVNAAIAAIRRQKADDPGAYYVDEDELHELWEGLFVDGELETARAIAAFRADEFPGSWAAHRALGETYGALGRESEAASSYATAREVNRGSFPWERQAAQEIESLLAGKKSLLRELEIAARRVPSAGGGEDERAIEWVAIDYRKRPEGYFVDERAMNRLGYELLRSDRIGEAITVFDLNVRAFPESWNVYDSLGEAYLEQGDVRRAIELYERSLALNPDNQNGADLLARIHDEMYLLPYPEGESYLLLQSNFGPYGHQGAAAYAYDFRMPIGTPVHATRGGEVVAVEVRFDDGTHKPGDENYVFIEHSDGTFGRYYHLQKGGALVAAGDRVERGQRIGSSGSSGASAGPHLHFDVTEKCPEWGCQTIPVRFANADDDPLDAGESYEALPMPAGGHPPS